MFLLITIIVHLGEERRYGEQGVGSGWEGRGRRDGGGSLFT